MRRVRPVSIEEVVVALAAAGHFPQVRNWAQSKCVHTAFRMDEEGCLRAPVVIVLRDGRGRWVLTGYQGVYHQVPDERDVPGAAVAVLRGMGYCMHFPTDVIHRYNLIELDPAEFEPADE
jgi:hypothetical protein